MIAMKYCPHCGLALIRLPMSGRERLACPDAKCGFVHWNNPIPVVAVLDSNSDPEGVDYPIPGNDDASRAIGLYCDLAARAVIDGCTAEACRDPTSTTTRALPPASSINSSMRPR